MKCSHSDGYGDKSIGGGTNTTERLRIQDYVNVTNPASIPFTVVPCVNFLPTAQHLIQSLKHIRVRNGPTTSLSIRTQSAGFILNIRIVRACVEFLALLSRSNKLGALFTPARFDRAEGSTKLLSDRESGARGGKEHTRPLSPRRFRASDPLETESQLPKCRSLLE